ncbi:MAG: ABC transporter ATP-binding protein [Parcubacteria group bacterium]|nr:ABC transporter ATP-binding protein [Parcubacteria group bacterium]
MSKPLTIELRGKTFHDKQPFQVLGKIKFDIAAGEFVSILGPSGCGKSTLLRLISGLDADFDGKIILGKRSVIAPERDCGIAFQEPRLLPWLSVRQNIAFGLYSENGKSTRLIDELLIFFDLKQFEDVFPSQLSGGMAQKVSLARAMVNLPDLLLLDEPFGALDELTKRRLQEEAQKVLSKEKTTVLMVTHDIEEAIYLSDRILLMSKRPGKILESYSVDLPKPRERTTQSFIELQAKILQEMRDRLKLF